MLCRDRSAPENIRKRRRKSLHPLRRRRRDDIVMARKDLDGIAKSNDDSAAQTRIDGRVVTALAELGFSQYEARTYTGLVGREPLTGYAIAKDTRVPQPKVYETLGRLVERGAVLQVSDNPAKFIAVPPARLIAALEATFRQRITTVELEISRMRPAEDSLQALRPYHEATSWMAIAAAARTLIEKTDTRLYVSGHRNYLEPLAEAVENADQRGVRIDILCFGEPPFAVSNGTVIRHSSTDGKVYRHHQARHLAVAGDGSAALWALAPEGEEWTSIWSESDALLTALVKGFVRHDMFMQRVYRDFSEQMTERYGAGLEGLFDWRPAQAPAENAAEPLKRTARRPA
jgi:sugar-specific transcriptional regulator TrmB